MKLKTYLSILLFITAVSGQEVKSSMEFYDTTADTKTGEIGFTGSSSTTTFFIEANGEKKVTIANDTAKVNGVLKADTFSGDGSKLTGITVDSISWSNIKDMPAGFADGTDDAGSSSGTADSVRAAAIADSSKKIPDGSVTNAKLSSDIKISDGNIDSISWSKIKGIPAGFADGVDNSETDTEGNATDSVRAASIADSCKKIPDGSVTEDKFATGLKITADSSRAALIADSCKKMPKIIDSAKVAKRADSLGTQPASSYALKTDLGTTTVDTATYAKKSGNTDSLGGTAASGYAKASHTHDDSYYTKSQSDSLCSVTNYCYSTTASYYKNNFTGGTTLIAASVTVTAPTAGIVVVIANANIQFINSSTSGYTVTGAILESPTTTPLEPNTIIIGEQNLMYSWSQTRVFSVESGEHTFNLYFYNGTSAEQRIWNHMITAIFCKTQN